MTILGPHGAVFRRLTRINDVFDADVGKGAIPGAVALISRRGKLVYLEAFGFRDREKKLPMAADSIFRIASMTKPMVSAAVMMLAEEGRIRLVNPVSTYLAELKGLQVGVEAPGPDGKPQLRLEPARREMSVQDLLRHTSGLTYGQFGDSLVKQAYRAANVFDPNQTTAEFISKLAQLPLQNQPGEVWDYSMSTDVLGRLVEVISGIDLDAFIHARITGPLGMHDTGFMVAQEQADRIAEPQIDPATGKRPPMPRDLTLRPNFLSGGGGMVSTAPDYLRFAQMLLNGGELDGVRILARKTVALMTSDHLPPQVGFSASTRAQFEESSPTSEFGQGFGLGFCVRKEPGRSPVPGSVGDFYWSGVHGTYFWVDPEEQLIGVLMLCAPELRRHYRALMRQLVYQALED
ncbi:MAG TPA: serine hydrolase domain-containing protein [Burkholderiales bacterium]|nr:serine hydrolase domain-containing protein [Burkholderiales bacterium]